MSAGAASLSSVFARFSAFERDADLFSREVCGVRFWHHIRFNVYSTYVLPRFVTMDAAHPDMRIKAARKNGFADRVASRVSGSLRSLRMLTLGNPSFALRRRDVLISLSPRTTTLPDGRRIRLAVDFFAEKLKSSWCVLEFPVGATGYLPNDGPGRVFRWEAAKRAAGRFRSSAAFKALRPEIASAAERLSHELSECFGIDVDEAAVGRGIGSAAVMELAAVPLLRGWLRRLGVRCVVEVVHYSAVNMALTRAAHEEGIPVVELQHGTIYPAHAAYNLPVKDSGCSPDFLLGWGERWLKQTSNFPRRDSIAVGYPCIESFHLASSRRAAADGTFRVLFISQGTVGRELADMAVELSRLLPASLFRITFKLHPSEMRSWRRLYPRLADSPVVVVDDASVSVYECFADSDVTVGACSTALIEGFVWGLRAYVVRGLAGADTMAQFCNGEQAMYVDTVNGLASCISGDAARTAGHGADFDREAYFRSGSADAVAEWIDRLAERSITDTEN